MNPFKDLEQLGYLEVNKQIQASFRHNLQSMVDFTGDDITETSSKVEVKTILNQDQTRSNLYKLQIFLENPITLKQSIITKGELFTLNSDIYVPKIRLPNLSKIDVLENRIKVINFNKNPR